MSSPSTNTGPVSDAFKAKITSLIQEQLKPIVTELAAQQQILLDNLALLKHNHNVNDYQSTRLESIRDLEQSINFKVAGVLGFDPSQHQTMGTNLREPVPADPELVPKFTSVDKSTRAERTAQSIALIKDAGTSARQIGVPLTFQDFPDHPSMNSRGSKKESAMHASIPLFGLQAPRWRAKQGLGDDRASPSTAVYDGMVTSLEGTGLQLYSKRTRELRLPLWKLVERGAESSPGTDTSNSPGVPAGATSSNTRTPLARHPTAVPSSFSSISTTLPARPKPLCRTYAVANLEDTISRSSPTSNNNNNAPVGKPSALRRTSTMATIGSTTSETSAYSSFSRVSTTATVGSELDHQPSSKSSRTTKVTTAKTKTKNKVKQSTAKQQQQRNSNTRTKSAAPTSTSSTSASTSTSHPTLKRGRRTGEIEDADDDDDMIQDQEEGREEEPASKRRKRSTLSDASSESTTRRSTRVTRASTAVPQPAQPSPRGRAAKGKKGSKRS